MQGWGERKKLVALRKVLSVVYWAGRWAAEGVYRVKEKKHAVNKEECFLIVWGWDLCVAVHLLCVALWVASHMRDQKYYEM